MREAVIHLADGRIFNARVLQSGAVDERRLYLNTELVAAELEGLSLKFTRGLPPQHCEILDLRTVAGVSVITVRVKPTD